MPAIETLLDEIAGGAYAHGELADAIGSGSSSAPPECSDEGIDATAPTTKPCSVIGWP